MPRLILISFADNRFRNSLVRLQQQTRRFPFDERHFLTEQTALSKKYWRKLKPWLYRRGFGFWAWKAQIVSEYMERLQEGDMIFWSDAGIYWNDSQEAVRRFQEYVNMLSGDKALLTFQQPTPEQEYTKGDVLEVFGVYDNQEICSSLQLWAGCFLIKKTQVMMEFLEKWKGFNDLKKDLITDKRSQKPNKPGFKDHRHDQSVFSLLTKQYPHIEIDWREVLPEDGNWDSLQSSPIQGRRLKEADRPKSEIIKNKLLRPWREILHLYFKRIKDYDYRGKYVW